MARGRLPGVSPGGADSAYLVTVQLANSMCNRLVG